VFRSAKLSFALPFTLRVVHRITTRPFWPAHSSRLPHEIPHGLRNDLSLDPTGNALFHLLASLCSAEVPAGEPACRKHIPVAEIRQLQAEGHSVAEIAQRTGATVSEVRWIVGKLDPAEKERRRKDQEVPASA
jgi:hypothetical protein